ncbi:proteobacterial dedicated sortase system histidine kinase [uncultured Paraglaciecola sp.]|jgi:two-component system, OmpR family, sensor histidine kinase ChvG|uniref:proteobacterial dedicated sortase system histidine kinase n=1 Tax=uncultured Paraglaciecola sp. TaxID=1765024 RepID=UPI0025F38423|nr:proteobacterial dedicated sortase system histidine kinase [uncultured Paraglaciecola sp.]
MSRLRFGLRLKLLFFSSFLLAIPWLGYQYVWEMETYLRIGQEQTMVGTARAVATALHERPALFDSQSAYLTDVKPGTDLYAHKIAYPIQLDGKLDDWQDYQHLTIAYGQQNLIDPIQDYKLDSLHFRHMVGQYDRFLYAMFDVTDNRVLLRPKNSLRIDKNDHLQIAMTDQSGLFQRYIIAPSQPGWVNAYLLKDDLDSLQPERLETKIQGQWRNTTSGYQLELRFPLAMMSSKIAFAIVDVDELSTRAVEHIIGTANPSQLDSLGTVLVPSPEIEQILKGLKYSNARVWVVDKHMRVLARSGNIQRASGMQDNSHIGFGDENAPQGKNSWWKYIENNWLLPLYYQILTKPPADFVDDLRDAFALQGQDISQALKGTPSSLWRLSSDNKAVIMSAAHPIYLDETVMGAVVVEQTTNGIRTLRNKALEQQFHYILLVILISTLALFLIASRISWRIRKLRDETESAIDQQGKIIGEIVPSTTRDEIGDLSRTFTHVLSRLSQYNTYLENMASRLSHELRTPVAIVNSSLDNLLLEEQNAESKQYVDRAKQGITRLSKILSNMSEATRLEQAIQSNERENFDLEELLKGCVAGYRLAYASRQFEVQVSISNSTFQGAPELFAQMLDKIIANAVEFSEENSVINLLMVNSEQGYVLTIGNQGSLLPENMQHQLLDSMVSVRKQQNTVQPHLGLGLYIAKIIAQYHLGDIRIDNLKDKSGVVVTLMFKVSST